MPVATMAGWWAAASWRKRLDIGVEGFAFLSGAHGPAPLRRRAGAARLNMLAVVVSIFIFGVPFLLDLMILVLVNHNAPWTIHMIKQ